ncbi:hypothetical protein BSKO_03133 [Bryopsis sp. KO-2023]|nr:hypothetical protein BSKO_03133 [Bryopsis sp. KO-2023]
MLHTAKFPTQSRFALDGGAFRNRFGRLHRPPRLDAGGVGRRSRISASSVSKSIEDLTHELPDGMKIEVLKQTPQKESDRPPVVFIHGSCHGAWCWKEYFMPFFAEAGYTTYAISVRGQGNSELGDLKVSGTIASIADDLTSFVATFEQPPVLVGHSFGALIVQKYSMADGFPPLSGVASVCGTPPSGNKGMVGRFLRKDFFSAMGITWAFIRRTFTKDVNSCRDMFFSKSIGQDDLERFFLEIQNCSPLMYLDLQQMQQEVPLGKSENFSLPAFVLGAENDMIVDREAVEETADFFNTSNFVMIPDMAHDCMLDTNWKKAAQPLKDWMDGI